MAIAKGYKANFRTIKLAASRGDLALIECADKQSGKTVIALAAISREGDDYVITPLAKMFDDNPYEELEPPK